MRDLNIAELKTLPPLEFHNRSIAKIANNIANTPRDDDRRPLARLAPREPRDGAQRGPVQVVEVSVRNQHRVDGRQVAQPQAGAAKPLKHEDPAGKVRVNQDVLPANLQEEAGMSDEGYAKLPAAGEYRFARDAGARRHGRMAN